MEKEWIYGKTVVVVGASSGIGKYLAFNLILRYNCKIIGISNNKNQMEEFYNRITEYHSSFEYYIFDATKEKDWQEFTAQMADEERYIDMVINCVGELPKFNSFESHSQKDITKIMNENFYSCIFSTRYLLPILKEADEPAIINVSCMASVFSVGGTSIYSAAKSALNSYTQILSHELDDKFYVGLVLLGTIKNEEFYKNQDNNMTDKILNKALTLSQASKKILYGICVKKRRIVVGANAKLFDKLNGIFPTLTPLLIKKYMKRKKIKLYN